MVDFIEKIGSLCGKNKIGFLPSHLNAKDKFKSNQRKWRKYFHDFRIVQIRKQKLKRASIRGRHEVFDFCSEKDIIYTLVDHEKMCAMSKSGLVLKFRKIPTTQKEKIRKSKRKMGKVYEKKINRRGNTNG